MVGGGDPSCRQYVDCSRRHGRRTPIRSLGLRARKCVCDYHCRKLTARCQKSGETAIRCRGRAVPGRGGTGGLVSSLRRLSSYATHASKAAMRASRSRHPGHCSCSIPLRQQLAKVAAPPVSRENDERLQFSCQIRVFISVLPSVRARRDRGALFPISPWSRISHHPLL
jgi:hypothetical protein